MHTSLLILLLSTASIAFIHSLAPDHWMPFAALAKSLKWSKLKLALLTFVSGIGHVGISVIFSIIGILLGFSLTKLKNAEGRRAEIALWLLIGFGIAYMLWGIKKARGHKHKAFDQKALKSKTLALWMIFIIVVLGPCEPLVPLVFLGYNYGYMGVISVSIVFSITTIAMMVAQSLLAFKGVQLIKNDFIEKYSHAFAGLIIVLTGIFVMVAGI